MTIETSYSRRLGTMIAYGFEQVPVEGDLALAHRIGAQVVEVLPDWRLEPDPGVLRRQVADAGMTIHSAHGCWGGQSIRASRVDLGHPSPIRHREAVEDLQRCVDWLVEAGGTHLVVHPGGLSDASEKEARRDALARGLIRLVEHARATPVILCVENMPTGVHPGSRMADLALLVTELDDPKLKLALDTGHAHISVDLETETLAAGRLLATTHVHDNNGRQDTHEPPGLGSISWPSWAEVLDAIEYRGPIILECIRHLRKHPERIDTTFLSLLDLLAKGHLPPNRHPNKV